MLFSSPAGIVEPAHPHEMPAKGRKSVMKAFVLAAALVAGSAGLCVAAGAAHAASLTVTVDNVSPKGGIVSLALFTRANYEDDDHPTLSRDVPATGRTVTIAIDDLPPGTYAIKMMQDINRNGKFDTSWIGLPLEPYGFSNNARPGFSEPSFNRTKFTVADGSNAITIHLSDTDGIDVPAYRRTASR